MNRRGNILRTKASLFLAIGALLVCMAAGGTAVNADDGAFTLTMEAAGSGGTSPQVGAHSFGEGEVVGIEALPAEGWQFDDWTGPVADPSSANTTVTMTDNRTVCARFSRIEYVLTISATGSGTVARSPDRETYHRGDVVALTPHPGAGWAFDGWTGPVADPSSANTTVTVSGNMTVTAAFSPVEDTNLAPSVLCLWTQEPVEKLESGDPGHRVGGCQINPTLAYGTTKPVHYYAVVTDPEDGGDLQQVLGRMYYPGNSPSPFRDRMDPDGTGSRFMYQVVFSRVDDPGEAAALVNAASAADLVDFAPGADLSGLTGPKGAIAAGTAGLWVGREVIAYNEPGGDYSVRVWARDLDGNRSQALSGWFNYVPTSGIEVDFTGIVYGLVDLNMEAAVAGDAHWGRGPAGEGQANRATVRNIGNVWAHVSVQQDDMGFVFVGAQSGTALVRSSPLGAASNWSVNYGVCLGSDDAFKLYYDPNVKAITPNFLGLGAMGELHLAILVKNGHGTHNGTMTIGSTMEPFGKDGAGNSLGPVGRAGS